MPIEKAVPLVLTNHFLPINYALNLVINYQKANFQGELAINLTKNENNHSTPKVTSITLNCSNIIIISSVFNYNGKSEKANIAYDRDNERVTLSINNIVPIDEKFQIQIKYMGRISKIKTYQDPTKGIFQTNFLDEESGLASNQIIATQSQASFARFIFPCLDEPSHKASIELSITTDKRFLCASSMNQLQKNLVSEDNVKHIFKKTPLIATSVFGFALGDFDYVEKSLKLLNNESFPLRIVIPKGQLNDSHYPLNLTSKSLPILEKMLGFDFPLPKLDIVFLPFLSDGAMENWGLIFIQSTLLTQSQDQLEQVIIHELVHQWFGNLVTLDEWHHLWLNESFATWMANQVINKMNNSLNIWTEKIEEMESVMEQDSVFEKDLSINSTVFMLSSNYKEIKSTQDIFENYSYEKGIFLLRMLSNIFQNENFLDSDINKFYEHIKLFLEREKFKSFKPIDLWKFLNPFSDYDIQGFMNTWTRLPGIPIVLVDSLEDGKIKVEQHRYIKPTEQVSLDQLKLTEDIPFHIPLAIKLKNSKFDRSLLTDRKLVLDLKKEKFLKLNANKIGYYRVKYNNVSFYDCLSASISELSSLDNINLLLDIEEFLFSNSQYIKEKDIEIRGFFKLINFYVRQEKFKEKVDYKVLSVYLRILQNIDTAIRFYSTRINLNGFQKWLDDIMLKLYLNIGEWPINYNLNINSLAEIESRKFIMMLGVNVDEINGYCRKLFKSLNHGPKNSVPKNLVAPVLNNLSFNSNSEKEFKKILQLTTRSSSILVNNISESNANVLDIQNSAIGSLGFTKDLDIFGKKVLNFVKTNFDSKGIELALIGTNYKKQSKKVEILWNWLKLNYKGWYPKTLREGSESGKEISIKLNNIIEIVFKAKYMNGSVSDVDEFIKRDKSSKLKEIYKEIKESQKDLAEIGKSITGDFWN
ncbi:Tma108p ASCRUDRAFT_121297 [Ascoidea rubescens DSM 1968]|uniref:Aminopeptidase n=1 Tax=Ascoidea rubescens DSM 1968 TaxID=1344418 RepID=A0A1D2V9X0_9ASCO|nr:hypothetical protein ASCRUDRAFT_121297 [Ascoidea rubescens DSM 1968]ODV58451.1 hypothetical protein ASCRUDRAFT_121297 [Ascoidea rubescens DSM 1968]